MAEKQERYVPTFTFHWQAVGQIAPAPYRVQCLNIVEALLWFHLEQQLKGHLDPSAYSIDRVTTDQTPPQSWAGAELPRRSRLEHCTVNKAMAKHYHGEIMEADKRGLCFNVA